MSEKTPSCLDMMSNFTKEVVEYAKQGAPHVTEAQYKERIRTCGSCNYLKQDVMRCGKCGCLVEHKAKWATTTCPDKRWDPVKVGSAGKTIKLKGNGKRKSNTTKASNKVRPTDTKD